MASITPVYDFDSTRADVGKNVLFVLRGTTGAGILALTTASAASSAFTEDTVILFYPDVDCFIKIGADPTSTTDGTSDRVLSDTYSPPYLIKSGEKISGIVSLGSGNLYWVKVG